MSNHDERELNSVEEVTKYISKNFFKNAIINCEYRIFQTHLLTLERELTGPPRQ